MKNLLMAFALILFTSCSTDDSPKDYSIENEEEIQSYIASNNLITQKSNSGLHYIISEQGTGIKPTIDDRVKVVYTGYLTNGEVFDKTDDDGVSFIELRGLISGWIEGLTYFNEGSKGKLIIPAHLAYGDTNREKIPAGSVLIFDIEVIYVNYGTENEEEIQKYITENNLATQQTDSGLHYVIDEVGTGSQPTQNDNVRITYSGYFLNDEIFDESSSEVNFNLQNVIKGFAEGLTYFNEGGSGTLLIPSHLAYGNFSTPTIPGGSVLIFDINLISVN